MDKSTIELVCTFDNPSPRLIASCQLTIDIESDADGDWLNYRFRAGEVNGGALGDVVNIEPRIATKEKTIEDQLCREFLAVYLAAHPQPYSNTLSFGEYFRNLRWQYSIQGLLTEITRLHAALCTTTPESLRRTSMLTASLADLLHKRKLAINALRESRKMEAGK